MKKLIKLQSVFLALILLGFTTTFTACSSDDDDDKRVSVTDVIGNYTGEISIDPIVAEKTDNATEEDAEKPSVQVTNDNIKITNLPFEAIVRDYIQDEEIIDDVLASIEAVNYDLSYTASINEKEDGLDLLIKAENPIEINYYLADDNDENVTRETGEEVEQTPNHTLLVFIQAEAEGVYKNKSLNFTLKVVDLAEKEASTFEENDNEEEPEEETGIYTYTFSLQKK
ncbi:MAG: DUF4840 domain-containing protein [Bacteroidales bacterium]|nr:DUF4840 domain-containing protein [Bacteroidales bacterium]